MENKNSSGLVSIKIVRGSELPESTRARYGISKDNFVEVRITRNSPPEFKILALQDKESPACRWRAVIEKEGLVGQTFP